ALPHAVELHASVERSNGRIVVYDGSNRAVVLLTQSNVGGGTSLIGQRQEIVFGRIIGALSRAGSPRCCEGAGRGVALSAEALGRGYLFARKHTFNPLPCIKHLIVDLHA